jgi:hypothetical protein
VSDLSDYLNEVARERDAIGPRPFAALADIPYSTARRLLDGSKRPAEETLRKVADNLRLSFDKLRRLNGMRPAMEPFILPSQASRLTMRQRRLVIGVILELAGENSDEVAPDYSNGAAERHANVLRFEPSQQRVTEAAWTPDKGE